MRDLRVILRGIVYALWREPKWRLFRAPVSEEEAPGYSRAVREPMDLQTLLQHIDDRYYHTLELFQRDVSLIPKAAKVHILQGRGH